MTKVDHNRPHLDRESVDGVLKLGVSPWLKILISWSYEELSSCHLVPHTESCDGHVTIT